MHPVRAQGANAASQSRLGDGNGVVRIDSAGALHSVVDIQNYFGERPDQSSQT